MRPTLSILVPTTGARAPFWPWLFWNIAKQQDIDWSDVEIVVACEEGCDPFALLGELEERIEQRRCIVRLDASTSIGEKRNALVAAARGAYVAWFDDDDWHHPQRLALQLDAASGVGGVSFAAWRYYLDLQTGLGVSLGESYRRKPNAMSFVGPTTLAKSTPFESVSLGEDTRWLAKLGEWRTPGALLTNPRPLVIGLLHSKNTTHAVSSAWRRTVTVGHFAKVLGEFWGLTEDELARLRARIESLPAM